MKVKVKGILKAETLCPKCKSPCVKEVRRKNDIRNVGSTADLVLVFLVLLVLLVLLVNLVLLVLLVILVLLVPVLPVVLMVLLNSWYS